MLIASVRRASLPLTLTALLLSAGPVRLLAQTPQTPTTNPTQRDATRPPGTQRNQPVPEQGRPIQQDPTAPPGTQRPSPQAPPGLSTVPQPSPTTPGQIDTPTALPSTGQPGAAQGTQTPGEQGLREPLFTDQTARPVPPMPNLTRLGVNSDQTISLSLNDAIRRALENNNDIEVARNDVRFAETQLRALQGVYEPVFSLTPQINRQVQSSLSILNLPSGGTSSSTISSTDYTLSPSVTKLFEKGGGSYEFFFNNNRRVTNQLQSTLNPAYSSSAGVTFTQPLLRDRAIDNNRRQIRIQRKRLEQSDADFRRSTIEVISQVQRAYWDLVFAMRDQQNRIANLNLARENFRRTEAQIAAGAAAPFGRAEVQTELANRESDLLIASQNVSIAENTLKRLLLRDPDSKDWTAQLVPTDTPSFDAAPINLNDALAEARKNRPEIQRLRLQSDINTIDINYFKNQTKPRVDIQSTFSKTGVAGSPRPNTGTTTSSLIDINNATVDPSAFLLQQLIQRGVLPANIAIPTVTTSQNVQTSPELIGGYGRNLRNLASLGTYNVVVGVAIQFPFHNRTAEANLAGVQIQKAQLEAQSRQQEQTVELEVRNAAQSVETSRRRVLAAREARRNAELQLAGEQRLYAVGRSTTFLLFQRENELANARNQELRSETDYNIALADLQRATSTTLRANHVTVETPTIP